MSKSNRPLACTVVAAFIFVGAQLANAAKPPAAKPNPAEGIFEDLRLPPLKGVRIELDPRKLAESHSFTEEQFEDYFKSGPCFREIEKDPSKFEGDFLIRVVTVAALNEMRKFDDGLPDEIRAPNDQKLKERIGEHKKRIAMAESALQELLERFEKIIDKRELENSKGWVAQWDYVYAQARLRRAWCYEYNLALQRVTRDQLPPLDDKAKHNGWRLSTIELPALDDKADAWRFGHLKMMSPKEIRDMADSALSDLAEIAKDHPKTPWAVLADKQKDGNVGLKWQPAKLE